MFRNREIRYFAAFFAVISAIAAAAGFCISPGAGILLIIFAAVSGAAFFIFTGYRYRELAKLSEEIDLVLHNADHLMIDDAEEGELSVMQSEITKMTSRIREQNARLIKEKENLADSLADIAHQLRTPLTSVNLILSLLRKCDDQTERRKLLHETEELLMKMDWLITSLLRLSRLDAGMVKFDRENIDVSRLIRSALHPFLISIDLHNISLKLHVPENMSLEGDFNWLSEALQNIIKNCIESSGDNGTIEISCEDNPLYSGINIHDSGSGFDKKDLNCLFDRYYRGKDTQTAGFGIGLALCRTIIMRQGATVTAKNHPEGGALFVIRFPK